jgi:competence protein ComEC
MTVATFTSILNQLLPEPHAGLLNGILFGTKATLSRDLYDALVATGTLHIVALSGMNITILESIIAKTLGYMLNKRVTGFLTILLIIGFIWFVGLSPSVIRAGIMGSMALISVIFGRQKWSLFFFAVTCGVMLLIHPAWIGDLSFQLSAGATLGIILFGPRIQKNVLIDTLYVTLAAQTLTIPIILFTFRRISLISPLTNVLIGWIIQPLTALGLIVAILGWIWLPIGQVFAWVAWVLLQYLILAIELTAKVPFSSVNW